MQVLAAGAAAPLASPPAASGRRRPWGWLLLGCLALAALSLLGPRETTYDPYAWLTWGREIPHLDLVTTSGPSWKPLPVLFTTLFSLFGDSAEPLLWQLVARTGGLFAFVLAYRLAARFAGPLAGAIATVSLILANQFIFNFARANSEGLLVALFFGAIERHLDGHRRQALALGVAAALLRPEVWPFLVLYGLWMLYEDRRAGVSPWPTVALLGGSAALIAVLWFVPEYYGSGNFFRAASRALESVPGSPALAKHPIIAVFPHSASFLAPPVYLGALIGTIVGVRASSWSERRVDPRLAFAALSTALMAIVAVLTEVGFTGNLRYVTLPGSVLCVLAGIGWSDAFGAVRRRAGMVWAVALLVVALVATWPNVTRLRDQTQSIRDGKGIYTSSLPDAIRRAGGEAAIRRCGPIYTNAFQTQAVVWALHLHTDQISIHAAPPGTVITMRPSSFTHDPAFPNTTLSDDWVVATTC